MVVKHITAVKTKADAIITRNGKDFTNSKIPVMTATEYISSIEWQYETWIKNLLTLQDENITP